MLAKIKEKFESLYTSGEIQNNTSSLKNKLTISQNGKHRVTVCICVCSVASNSLQTHKLESTRLLCPWNFPGKNTGVGCHFLLHRLFLTRGLNLSLLHPLHWQVDSLPLHHLESLPKQQLHSYKNI